MCFCETNPPFLLVFSNANASVYMSCSGNQNVFSVGSFWKTNPPEGAFRWVIEVLSAHFDLRLGRKEPADAYTMGCGRMQSWRCWLLERLGVSRETLRRAQGDNLRKWQAKNGSSRRAGRSP